MEKTDFVSIRVPEDMKDRLDARVPRNKKSLLIRRLLEMFLTGKVVVSLKE